LFGNATGVNARQYRGFTLAVIGWKICQATYDDWKENIGSFYIIGNKLSRTINRLRKYMRKGDVLFVNCDNLKSGEILFKRFE